MGRTKSYSELIKIPDFKGRLEYLKLDGSVGDITFGSSRYLNQRLYNSPEWKRVKRQIIIRDNACDLGVEGMELNSHISIHHINPLTIEQVMNKDSCLFDPENLIVTSRSTHQAIHFGSDQVIALEYTERRPNDTCPWKVS